MDPMLDVMLEDDEFKADHIALRATCATRSEQQEYLYNILLADANNYVSPRQYLKRCKHFFHPPMKDDLISRLPELRVPSTSGDGFRLVSVLVVSKLFAMILNVEEWTTQQIKAITSTAVRDCALLLMDRDLTLSDQDADKRAVHFQRAWSKVAYGLVRWAIHAGTNGPDGADTMKILGKDETRRRLDLAKTLLEERHMRKDDLAPCNV